MGTFNTPLRAIHQIEISSVCNLRCPYCPQGAKGLDGSTVMSRPKVLMEWTTFVHAIDIAVALAKKEPLGELNLAGLGESTIHPLFPKMVEHAFTHLPRTRLVLATNGAGVDDALATALVPFRERLYIYVSMHTLAGAAPGIAALARHRLVTGSTADPAVSPNDWAGQVKWETPKYEIPCPWLGNGWGFIAANGDILACCLDASGVTRIGHIADEPLPQSKPSTLCRGCYQKIVTPGFDQKLAG